MNNINEEKLKNTLKNIVEDNSSSLNFFDDFDDTKPTLNFDREESEIIRQKATKKKRLYNIQIIASAACVFVLAFSFAISDFDLSSITDMNASKGFFPSAGSGSAVDMAAAEIAPADMPSAEEETTAQADIPDSEESTYQADIPESENSIVQAEIPASEELTEQAEIPASSNGKEELIDLENYGNRDKGLTENNSKIDESLSDYDMDSSVDEKQKSSNDDSYSDVEEFPEPPEKAMEIGAHAPDSGLQEAPASDSRTGGAQPYSSTTEDVLAPDLASGEAPADDSTSGGVPAYDSAGVEVPSSKDGFETSDALVAVPTEEPYDGISLTEEEKTSQTIPILALLGISILLGIMLSTARKNEYSRLHSIYAVKPVRISIRTISLLAFLSGLILLIAYLF